MIDASEWIGPHDDMILGLHKTARYYSYPGWHEPGTVNDFGFIREQSEKTPMARKVHASFTKFQALVGPWDHVAEGAYHQLLAGAT